jgi:tRNA threonylcarbamoyladenosine biosynthesis protein TsaE
MSEQIVLQSESAAATEQLGEDIGRRLRGGEVIELLSDLGGGKTTFVRGLARGAASSDHVASPTFTVSKVYKTPKFSIHHFDFYRLQEAGLMEHELQDLLGDAKIVVVVEWGEVVKHILPERRLKIEISQTSNDGRELVISAHPSLEYLLEQS